MVKLNKFTGRDQVPNVFKNRSYLTKVTNLCLHRFDDNLVITFNQIRRKPAFNATLIPSLSAIAATPRIATCSKKCEPAMMHLPCQL